MLLCLIWKHTLWTHLPENQPNQSECHPCVSVHASGMLQKNVPLPTERHICFPFKIYSPYDLFALFKKCSARFLHMLDFQRQKHRHTKVDKRGNNLTLNKQQRNRTLQVSCCSAGTHFTRLHQHEWKHTHTRWNYTLWVWTKPMYRHIHKSIYSPMYRHYSP